MTREEFISLRKKLSKTQKQMAELLGVSLKAVHSYEQGWRTVPGHVERQMFFLISRARKMGRMNKPCWTVKKCPSERKKQCPAWEYRSGTICWFVNGTVCDGVVQSNWKEKMKICRKCCVLKALTDTGNKVLS